MTMPSAAACVSDQSPWHRRATTVSYYRVVWTGTARCVWHHWSVATSSVSLCRRPKADILNITQAY